MSIDCLSAKTSAVAMSFSGSTLFAGSALDLRDGSWAPPELKQF